MVSGTPDYLGGGVSGRPTLLSGQKSYLWAGNFLIPANSSSSHDIMTVDINKHLVLSRVNISAEFSGINRFELFKDILDIQRINFDVNEQMLFLDNASVSLNENETLKVTIYNNDSVEQLFRLTINGLLVDGALAADGSGVTGGRDESGTGGV